MKHILVAFLLLAVVTASSSAAEPVKIGKILILGNSITEHGAAPNIDWLGNWGMAASAKEKDYAHLVIGAITASAGKPPEAMIQNIANYEREYDTYDLTEKRKDLFAFKADVVILAIGENVPELKSEEAKAKFKASVLKVLGALKDSNHPVIVVRSCFWPNAAKDEVLKQASQEVGGIFVDISNLSKDESNYARSERKLKNEGVGNHPGDQGMQAIANALVQALRTNHVLQENSSSDSGRAGQKGASGPQFSPEEKKAQSAAGDAVLKNIQASLGRGEKQIVIPSGNYRFETQDFLITGAEDVTIEADGAVFWFNQQHGVKFDKCRKVTFNGVTIDSDPLPWLQGVITKFDTQSQTIDLTLEEGYSIPTPEQLQRAQKRLAFYDGGTRLELPFYDDSATQLEKTGEKQLRIVKSNSQRSFLDPAVRRRPQAGDIVLMSLIPPQVRGIDINHCSQMTMKNITVYAARASPFHEGGGEGGHRYLGCKAIRRPGTNRLLVTPADGFHSYLVEKGPLIDGCEISHTQDDGLNIHGFFGMVMETVSPQELVVGIPLGGHGEVFRQGFPIDVFDSVTSNPRGRVTVESISQVTEPERLKDCLNLTAELKKKGMIVRDFNPASVVRLKLDKPVKAQRYDLVSSTAFAGAGTIIRNSCFHNIHTRGLLIRSANVTVENNVIERTMHGGIVIVPEHYWLEGPLAHDVIIRNNRLSENGWGAFERAGKTETIAAIEVGVHMGFRYFPWVILPGILNSEIKIESNIISRPASFGILVMNTHQLTITGNRISEPFAAGEVESFYDWTRLVENPESLAETTLQTLRKPYYPIFVLESTEVTLKDNESTDNPGFVKALSAQWRRDGTPSVDTPTPATQESR